MGSATTSPEESPRDDRDWTWVLDRPCPDCGYQSDALTRDELAPRVRSVAASWREMLARGAVVTQRPHATSRRWSIGEYGAHVRDVFELFEDRLRLILKKRNPPTFSDWSQDDAAVEGAYSELDPAKVAYELASNAGKVADVLDRVRGEDWKKQGRRSDGVEFTVESLVRYLLHDVEHHLWDANEILDGN